MKKDKIITFEEEKRAEKIKNVYSTVFLVAFFTFVIRLLCFYPIRSLNESGASDILKILIELICESAAVFIPFFVYGKIYGIGFKTVFARKRERNITTVSFLSGAGLCGLAAFLYFPVLSLFEKLSADGFVFNEIYPASGNSFAGMLFYTAAVPLISAAVTEFSLRCVVLENIKSASKWFSVFAVMVLNICIYPAWSELPITVISSFALSWLYIKTGSTAAVFLCGYFSRLVPAVLKMISLNLDISRFSYIISIVGAVIFLISFIIITVKYKWSLGEKTEDMFSKREGIKAVFGNSAVYMLIFLSAIQIFYFYVKKPENDSSDKTEKEVFSKYERWERSDDGQEPYSFTVVEKML